MVVLDEADRFMEANHFEELRQLFLWLRHQSPVAEEEEEAPSKKLAGKKRRSPVPTEVNRGQKLRRQTMVFSATLTFVHRGALQPGTGAKGRKRLMTANAVDMTKELKLSEHFPVTYPYLRTFIFEVLSAFLVVVELLNLCHRG